MNGLYCIDGFAKAAKKFENRPGANAEFENQMKKAHIPESTNLIKESSILNILSQGVAGHCLSRVFFAIKTEYKKLGFVVSEDCLKCEQVYH